MKDTIQAFGVVQGVSQQPDAIRLRTQGARQENGYSSPLEGLVTRQPFDWVAMLAASSANIYEPLVHAINRDPVERYIVSVEHKNVRVFELDGTSVPVVGPAAPADFTTYLSLEVANTVLSPLDFTGPDWTLNAGALITTADTGKGPLGYGVPRIMGSAPGATRGEYAQPQGTFVSGPQTFSVYARRQNIAFDSNGFTLILRDTTFTIDHTVVFVWSGTDLTLSSATLGGVGAVEALTNGWWRASITVNVGTNNIGSTVVGSGRTVAVKMNDVNGVNARTMHGWGAFLNTGASAAVYVYEPNKYLKAVTIADYTFVLNTLKATAKTGAVAASTDWTKTAYVFVKAGNYDRTYTVVLRKSGGADKTITVKSLASTGWVAGQTKTVSTEDIAQDIVDQVNSNATPASGISFAANTIAADGWAATRSGSIVKITRGATNIDRVNIGSASGDRDLSKIWSSVTVLGDLPVVMDDGVIVKVQGSLDTTTDDFYTKFVADTTGVFGPGHWVETTAPGVNTTIDGNTMPWTLIRRQDDAGGTHTGIAYAKYFEWAPQTWTTRLVGDDATNPMPSLVSTASVSRYINDIFFFKNRLGLTSSQNVVMSEVSRFFNFFRTTTLGVPDSDPIDIAVPHTRAVSVNHAVPHHERLVLLSDFTNFILQGDPILSPKTVQVTPMHEFESHRYNRPVSIEQGLFFTAKEGDFSLCSVLVPSDTVDTLDAFRVTAHVPRYIAGDARFMAASSLASILFVASETDRSVLYVYKFSYSGSEQQQSSWSKFTLGSDARVLGMGFIDTDLYLVVRTAYGVHLMRTKIADGLSDAGTNYVCRLDRRVKAGPDAIYAGVFAAGNTVWTVGQFLGPIGQAVKVVRRVSPYYSADGGAEITGATYDAAAGTITVAGDYSLTPVWIGRALPFLFEFSKPYVKRPSPDGKSAAPEQAVRLTLDRASIYFSDTGAFNLSVALFRRGTYTESYAPTLDTPPSLGQLVLKTDTYRFGIHCLAPEATVTVSSSSHLPIKLGGIEWEVQTASNAKPDGA